MLIITVLTLVLSLFIAGAAIFRRYRRFTNIIFAVSITASAFVIFGDAMSLHKQGLVLEWKRIVFICESIMVVAWLIFSLSFARTEYWSAVSRFSKLIVALSPVFIISFMLLPMKDFFYAPDLSREMVLYLGNTGYIFNILLLFYSVLAIINLEATLRSSSGDERWEIKYTLMGAGTILSFNIFYYSQALLYRSINMYLLPVRSGIVLIALIIIGFSIFRHRALDTELRISRNILYRSFSLVIVGLYLLVLGLTGQGMRYFSPGIGENITAFVGFAGALMLLIIIFSERIRKRTRVYINKNFFHQKYDYREQWLQFTQRTCLKDSARDLRNAIVSTFKYSLGVTGAALWLNDSRSGGYRCVTSTDHMPEGCTADESLIEFLRDNDMIIDCNRRNCRDIVAANKEFIEATGAILIVPLAHNNKLEGFITLKDGLAGNHYNYEDYDLLRVLSRHSTILIMNERLSGELTEARELEAMGRLSSFIVHDLKNAASMLSLVTQNAERHMNNPDFQKDAIRTVTATADKITGIIGKLRNLPQKASLDLEVADLAEHVRLAIANTGLNGDAGLIVQDLSSVSTSFDSGEIAKIINNLVINALEATQNKGPIKVIVGRDNDMAVVRVSDRGCGMSREFIEGSLFKPFQTTKKKGLGIGLYQCKCIAESHGGRLTAISEQGKGTEFALYLPLEQ